jgi:hypothetical protein
MADPVKEISQILAEMKPLTAKMERRILEWRPEYPGRAPNVDVGLYKRGLIEDMSAVPLRLTIKGETIRRTLLAREG